MDFMDMYKRLEKLCNDLYKEKHGISLYITEMIEKSNGKYYVNDWDKDLKKLKHYRWVRNKLVHDFDFIEEELYDEQDIIWLQNFHNRILNQDDPLAKYHRFIKSSDKNLKETNSINYNWSYFIIILLVILLLYFINS